MRVVVTSHTPSHVEGVAIMCMVALQFFYSEYQSFQPYKIFMRVTCASIENTEKMKTSGGLFGGRSTIKVTSELQKSRTRGGNLTFDP